jgi:hypothetical protein
VYARPPRGLVLATGAYVLSLARDLCNLRSAIVGVVVLIVARRFLQQKLHVTVMPSTA